MWDAAVLTFEFIPDGDNITFDYQFGSTEYNFFVNSSFNDIFGFFVNGVDFATIPGTTTPVAINTVNCGQSSGGTSIISPGNPPITNCELFENNRTEGGLTGSDKAIDLGGFVQKLSFLAPVNRGVVNTITIAIADTSDEVLDSAVFIKQGTLQVCGGDGQPPCPNGPKVPEPSSLAMIGLGAITLGLMRRRKSS